MSYQITASKLQYYQRCPQAYYFHYERGMKLSGVNFGSAALGDALHKTLADIYGKWHYSQPIPDRQWLFECWHQHQKKLTPAQISEGEIMLNLYYDKFIKNQPKLRKPLVIEGRIKANLTINNLEFQVTGRCDRIDLLDDGLELIDYKTSKIVKTPEQAEIDLQMGLYYLALKNVYGKLYGELKYVSLLYLRTGEKVTNIIKSEYQKSIEKIIYDIAVKMRQDCQWEGKKGKQCKPCPYARYCPTINENPEPLPDNLLPQQGLQLSLELDYN